MASAIRIFLAFDAVDKDVAATIRYEFQSLGVEVYCFSQSGSIAATGEVSKMIRFCDAFVCILSKEASDSLFESQQLEIAEAQKLKKEIYVLNPGVPDDTLGSLLRYPHFSIADGSLSDVVKDLYDLISYDMIGRHRSSALGSELDDERDDPDRINIDTFDDVAEAAQNFARDIGNAISRNTSNDEAIRAMSLENVKQSYGQWLLDLRKSYDGYLDLKEEVNAALRTHRDAGSGDDAAMGVGFLRYVWLDKAFLSVGRSQLGARYLEANIPLFWSATRTLMEGIDQRLPLSKLLELVSIGSDERGELRAEASRHFYSKRSCSAIFILCR